MVLVNDRRGFTLIEVIVVAAIIAILAGILVPMIFSQIDESKKARAQGDVKSIQNAFTAFYGTTKKWPIYPDPANCTTPSSLITSSGVNISNTWPLGATTARFADNLNVVAGHACYNNPAAINLVADVGPDPWGNRYIMNAPDLLIPGAPVWIISAGPNGVLDTSLGATTLNDAPVNGALPGDDIGVRIQ